MHVFCNSLTKCVTRKSFRVAMGAWTDFMLLVVLLETKKSRIAKAVELKERIFADWDGLELETASGAPASL